MTPAPVIIAVDGRSGAGKTTLAVELAARLREHHKVSLFHLEDIYPGWNGLASGIERYVATVLAPLRDGKPAEWISWDWEKHYDGRTQVTLPAEIVIVEGVGAAAQAARGMLDAVVWVEASGEDRRRRALARDGGSYEPYWDAWAQQEEEWLAVDPVTEAADIRVQNPADGSAPEDYTGGRNFGHLAYRVDDIYATCQRLMDAGVTINRPPRDGHMAFVRSPDGISVELLQEGYLDPAEPWASMPNTGSW